jgi:alanyl-tRNA synthetase
VSDTVHAAAQVLKTPPAELTSKVESLQRHSKGLEKELELLKARLAIQQTDSIVDDIHTVNGVKLVAKRVSADNPGTLREMADRFKHKVGSGIVILGSVSGDKVLLIVGVTKDLTARYPAGKIIKPVAALVGGSGGGRPDMAQAGGSKPEKLDEALQSAPEVVARLG